MEVGSRPTFFKKPGGADLDIYYKNQVLIIIMMSRTGHSSFSTKDGIIIMGGVGGSGAGFFLPRSTAELVDINTGTTKILHNYSKHPST